MGAGIDLKLVQERYAQMSDSELTYLVMQNGQGLTQEALEIAKHEIAKRGLNACLAEVVEIQLPARIVWTSSIRQLSTGLFCWAGGGFHGGLSGLCRRLV